VCHGPAESAWTDEHELDGRGGRVRSGVATEHPERVTVVVGSIGRSTLIHHGGIEEDAYTMKGVMKMVGRAASGVCRTSERPFVGDFVVHIDI
jgi:hypothetical protein